MIILVAVGAVFEIKSIAKLGGEALDEKRRENEAEHKRMMRAAIEQEKLRLAQQDLAAKGVKTDESREDNEA